MLLEIRKVSVNYGKVSAIRDISMGVPDGGIVTIIGGNGAGKTTTLRAISGLEPLRSGEIHFDGERIDHLPAHRIVARGIAHVPEGRRVFPDLTVEENLQLGGWTFRRDRKQVRAMMEANYERFPVLRDKRKQITGELSGGQQRMVEIGRTLMANPKMLLIDEPTAGLSKMLAEEVYEMLTVLTSRDNLTILIVDQEIRQALKISDYVYVLELGRNKFEGAPADFDDLEKAFWVG